MRLIQYLGWVGILGLLVLVGCTNPYAYKKKLPVPEQPRYRAYSQVMTHEQSRKYLSLPTEAECDAYAREIGVAQKLEVLSPREREAVLSADVFKGMSEQALRLVWGDPCDKKGPSAHEKWRYEGPAYALPETGWNCSASDTYTEVQLANGKVEWWKEHVRKTPLRRF